MCRARRVARLSCTSPPQRWITTRPADQGIRWPRLWIAGAAQDSASPTKSENALACVDQPCDDRSWESIRNVFANSAYRGFTLLRLVEHGCNPWGTDREAYA